jgi:hypothetical protein
MQDEIFNRIINKIGDDVTLYTMITTLKQDKFINFLNRRITNFMIRSAETQIGKKKYSSQMVFGRFAA